jgi:hypothetical protein
VDRAFLAVLPGSPAQLVWAVYVRGVKGTVRVLVDATSGAVLRTESLVRNVDNEPTLVFDFNRTSDKFEQVQAYHAVTEAQTYIQSLGFTNINNESQDLLINTIAVDNSFYDPAADTITLGRGGVDDAEDEDIVWHELGHAIHDDQVPGTGSVTTPGPSARGGETTGR